MKRRMNIRVRLLKTGLEAFDQYIYQYICNLKEDVAQFK